MYFERVRDEVRDFYTKWFVGRWPAAAGLLMSPLLTQQQRAGDFVDTACRLSNSAPVWSYDRLRIVPLGDVAITGNGFLQVRRPNGESAYTRAGQFSPDADGYLQNSAGFYLLGWPVGDAPAGPRPSLSPSALKHDGLCCRTGSNRARCLSARCTALVENIGGLFRRSSTC